ncbi:MAG TPA: amidohydrolase family protein [Rheinheimera sp.]|nr:amidohydrolase family protein [Rheinheimera sp.]
MKIALLLGVSLTWLYCAGAGAAERQVVNKLYSEKGEAGEQVIRQQDAEHYSASLKMSWNNRVVTINETLQLDSKGVPVAFSASGTSAFGAPIAEEFSLVDGVARWSGNKDEGMLQTTEPRFYLPADGAGAASYALMKALLASPTSSVDLFPGGTAKLDKLKTVTIKNGNNSEEVTLYAISGLAFNPSFGWFDKDGHYFAQDFSGFMRVIRDGYSLENFAELTTIQKQAENDYLANIASHLSHRYDTVLLQGGTVVDVLQRKQLANTDVLVSQGKITAIGTKLAVPAGAKVVDVRGKTLVPGLWDMHGHLSKNDGLLNIAAGVTSVRDIGNSHDNIMEIDRLFNSDQLIGNRVYRAGFFDQQSEYSAGLSVKSLQEAHEKIDWFADNGYLQIKIYSSIDPKWVKPIAEHAHHRGMRLSGHVPAFMTARQAIENGFDEIQHVNMLFLNFLAGDDVDTRTQLRFSLVGEKAGSLDLTSQPVKDFIQLLAQKQITVDPTVATFRSLLLGQNKQIDPEFAMVADHLPPGVVRQLKGATMKVSAEMLPVYQQSADALVKMVKLLYDAGVPIVPGTDHIAGFTLQRELELYAQAGIPALDVLRIASLESARLVGAAHYSGSISVGKNADLLVIDGDPIKSISDIRKVALVFKGAHYYKPEELYPVVGVKPFTASLRLH